MAAIDLKTKDLEKTIDQQGLVVIDCWAPWCAPCKLYGPIYERVSAEYPKVTFARVNVDQEPAIAQAFGVRGIPTTIMFRDGVPLFEQAGMLPEPVLKKLVDQALALNMAEVRQKIAQEAAQEQKSA
jgi:thioredoxin